MSPKSAIGNLAMNTDPEALFTATRALAQATGLDTAQLDAIVELGRYHYLEIECGSPPSLRRKRDNLFARVQIL